MLNLITINEFDKVYEILEQSFPLNERRTYQGQKQLLNKDYYKIYALKEKEEIKAFIAVYELQSFIFIEHFAVNERYRNQGLGSLILSELNSIYDKPFILEVEKPEIELAKRRIEFYKRNGFFYNDYHYIQPSLNDTSSPIELKIMSTKTNLKENEFFEVAKRIYNMVYNVKNYIEQY